MRNAIFPSVSSQSQRYRFGNNEVQVPNLDVSVKMDWKMNGLLMESRVFNHENQLRGYQSTTLSSDNITQQPILFSNKFSAPQFKAGIQNARKRPIESNDRRVDNTFDQWKRNKTETAYSREQFHHVEKESKGSQGNRGPTRKGQKLGDKITALQKLVSPYGKTDTASVLQEAHLYIDLLQNQIKNLFHVLSSSYKSNTALHPQGMERKEVDLQSRGLCLVPVSFTHKLTKAKLGSSSSCYLTENIQCDTFRTK